MMKFDWKIDRLLKKTSGDLPGLVTEVHWHVIGTDENGKSDWFSGAFSVSAPETTKFIKFEDLSKNQVLKWVQDYVANDIEYNINHIEDQIRKKIQMQDIEPVIGDDLPWSIRL